MEDVIKKVIVGFFALLFFFAYLSLTKENTENKAYENAYPAIRYLKDSTGYEDEETKLISYIVNYRDKDFISEYAISDNDVFSDVMNSSRGEKYIRDYAYDTADEYAHDYYSVSEVYDIEDIAKDAVENGYYNELINEIYAYMNR